MTYAETLQTRFIRERRYQGILWTVIAVAAYILAFSLATTNAPTEFGDWPRNWELPIQEPIDVFFEWIGDAFAWFFNPISEVMDAGLAGIDTFLVWLPWPFAVASASMLGFKLVGRWLGLFNGVAVLFIGMNGFWDSAMVTFSVVGVSVIVAVGLGVPIGILAAFNNRFETIVRPVLVTMQVLPAFVYLIPALVVIRDEWHTGRLPCSCLFHSSRNQAHQPGGPTSPPGRNRDGPLARIVNLPDAASGAVATGEAYHPDWH